METYSLVPPVTLGLKSHPRAPGFANSFLSAFSSILLLYPPPAPIPAPYHYYVSMPGADVPLSHLGFVRKFPNFCVSRVTDARSRAEQVLRVVGGHGSRAALSAHLPGKLPAELLPGGAIEKEVYGMVQVHEQF